MKLHIKNKVEKKKQYFRERYIEIPDIIIKKHNLRLKSHQILRVALDNFSGQEWSRVIERPAVRTLELDELITVCTRMLTYHKNLDLLYDDIVRSNSYRSKSDSISGDVMVSIRDKIKNIN